MQPSSPHVVVHLPIKELILSVPGVKLHTQGDFYTDEPKEGGGPVIAERRKLTRSILRRIIEEEVEKTAPSITRTL